MKNDVSRRQFLKRAALVSGGIALSGPIASILAACGGAAAPAAPAQPAAPAPAPAAPAGPAVAAQAPAQPQAPAPALEPAPAAPAAAAAGAAAKLTGPIRFLTWSGYYQKKMVEPFEANYGINISHIPIDNNAEAFGKIKAQGTGAYDVIGQDGLWCREYHRAGFVEPFDFKSFATYDQWFPGFANFEPWLVEGDMLAVPAGWSPYGIIYNTKFVDPSEVETFRVFFDPKYEGRVALRDNANRNFIMTASSLGFDGFEVDTPEGSRWDLPDDVLQRAKEEMIKHKKNFKLLWRSGGNLVRALAAEEIYVAFGNMYEPLRALDTGNPNIAFSVPKERTIGWVDGHMLVKNAKNKAAALKWLEHMSSAEAQMTVLLGSWFPTLNKKALDTVAAMGNEERLEKMNAYHADEWAERFSLFRPAKTPSKFQDAYAEFLAA